MEVLSALLALCEGNPALLDSPHKGPVMQSFDVLFVSSLSNLFSKE